MLLKYMLFLSNDCRNAIEHPGEEHYRHLHTTNKTFSTKVWRHSNAREFMLSVGWVLLEDSVVLPSDNLLQDALVALTKTKRFACTCI